MESGVVTEPFAGQLYIVSTPIGHMGDFSFRAIEVLRSVAAVLAEDTRHSRHLLDHYDIRTPLVAYHEHNEARSVPKLIARLRGGESLALISDAGTPILSDPGARLVDGAVEAGITVVPVPGASALLGALVVAGLPVEKFTFFGFLARRGRERTIALNEIAVLRHTAVLYEAPGRVASTLADLVALGAGKRGAVVCRELTKQFEETRRGTVDALAAYYEGEPPRGEIVIVIAGATNSEVSESALRERSVALRAEGLSARDIATTLSRELGAPRNLAYRIAHES